MVPKHPQDESRGAASRDDCEPKPTLDYQHPGLESLRASAVLARMLLILAITGIIGCLGFVWAEGALRNDRPPRFLAAIFGIATIAVGAAGAATRSRGTRVAGLCAIAVGTLVLIGACLLPRLNH